MKTIPRSFYKMPVNILFFTVVPVFYFLFVLAYDPFDIGLFLDAGQGRFTLNLIISTLIVLGVTVISRMLLFILRRGLDLNWWLYILWCFGEVILIGLFLSIPLGIGWSGEKTYFSVMITCCLYMTGILVFPLTIISMGVQLHNLSVRAALAPQVDERTLIRFYDEFGRLKIVLSADAILYLESEENYVHIVHLERGRVRDYELRSSMRALEDTLVRHGLVRCHRSYFVNPAHVAMIKKDPGGYALAHLSSEGTKEIPVSKNYYAAVTALL